MEIAYLTRIMNEEDLIYYHLKFHYNLGIRAFFITFNNSNQETIALVEKFFGEYTDARLFKFYEKSTSYTQSEQFDLMSKDAYEKGYKWQVPLDADELVKIGNGLSLQENLKRFDKHPHGHIDLKWFNYNHTEDSDDNSDPNYFTRWQYRDEKEWGYTKIIYKWAPGNKHGYGHHSMIANQHLIGVIPPSEMFIAHFRSRNQEQLRKKVIRIGEAFIERFGIDSTTPQVQTYKRWKEQGDTFFDEMWEKTCADRRKRRSAMVHDPIDKRMFE